MNTEATKRYAQPTVCYMARTSTVKPRSTASQRFQARVSRGQSDGINSAVKHSQASNGCRQRPALSVVATSSSGPQNVPSRRYSPAITSVLPEKRSCLQDILAPFVPIAVRSSKPLTVPRDPVLRTASLQRRRHDTTVTGPPACDGVTDRHRSSATVPGARSPPSVHTRRFGGYRLSQLSREKQGANRIITNCLDGGVNRAESANKAVSREQWRQMHRGKMTSYYTPRTNLGQRNEETAQLSSKNVPPPLITPEDGVASANVACPAHEEATRRNVSSQCAHPTTFELLFSTAERSKCESLDDTVLPQCPWLSPRSPNLMGSALREETKLAWYHSYRPSMLTLSPSIASSCRRLSVSPYSIRLPVHATPTVKTPPSSFIVRCPSVTPRNHLPPQNGDQELPHLVAQQPQSRGRLVVGFRRSVRNYMTRTTNRAQQTSVSDGATNKYACPAETIPVPSSPIRKSSPRNAIDECLTSTCVDPAMDASRATSSNIFVSTTDFTRVKDTGHRSAEMRDKLSSQLTHTVHQCAVARKTAITEGSLYRRRSFRTKLCDGKPRSATVEKRAPSQERTWNLPALETSVALQRKTVATHTSLSQRSDNVAFPKSSGLTEKCHYFRPRAAEAPHTQAGGAAGPLAPKGSFYSERTRCRSTVKQNSLTAPLVNASFSSKVYGTAISSNTNPTTSGYPESLKSTPGSIVEADKAIKTKRTAAITVALACVTASTTDDVDIPPPRSSHLTRSVAASVSIIGPYASGIPESFSAADDSVTKRTRANHLHKSNSVADDGFSATKDNHHRYAVSQKSCNGSVEVDAKASLTTEQQETTVEVKSKKGVFRSLIRGKSYNQMYPGTKIHLDKSFVAQEKKDLTDNWKEPNGSSSRGSAAIELAGVREDVPKLPRGAPEAVDHEQSEDIRSPIKASELSDSMFMAAATAADDSTLTELLFSSCKRSDEAHNCDRRQRNVGVDIDVNRISSSCFQGHTNFTTSTDTRSHSHKISPTDTPQCAARQADFGEPVLLGRADLEDKDKLACTPYTQRFPPSDEYCGIDSERGRPYSSWSPYPSPLVVVQSVSRTVNYSTTALDDPFHSEYTVESTIN